jgi:hypothetical protein
VVDLSKVQDVRDGRSVTGKANTVQLKTASGGSVCYICESGVCFDAGDVAEHVMLCLLASAYLLLVEKLPAVAACATCATFVQSFCCSCLCLL